MRRFLGFFVVIVCVVVYAISSDNRLTNQFEAYKFQTESAISSDRYRYGDLYGFSYLTYFRKHHGDNALTDIKFDTSCERTIHLYEVCDSYIWSFLDDKKYYCGVDTLTIVKTNNREKLSDKLDTTQINMLLVEIAERNIRDILRDTNYVNNLIKVPGEETGNVFVASETYYGNSARKSAANQYPKSSSEKSSFLNTVKSFVSGIADVISYKDLNKNIESNLWDYSLFTPVKEFKADLNLRLFGAIDNNVSISNNQQQLFYNLTTDTFKLSSSFKYVADSEINILVENLNKIYRDGKKAGFKAIYFTIVPNPVSIIEPGYKKLDYNNLAERIQQHHNLQIPVIDLVKDYRKSAISVYSKSDSHWNMAGLGIWLNKFNDSLKAFQIKNVSR